MSESTLKPLMNSPLFNGVEEAEAMAVFQGITPRVADYNKRDIIAHAGDIHQTVDVVLEGVVYTVMLNAAGKMMMMHKIGAGGLLAPAFVILNAPLQVSIQASTPVRLLRLSESDFRTMLSRNTVVMTNFIKILSHLVVTLTHKVNVLSMKTAKGKVADHILKLMREQHSQVVHLSSSRQELADGFGIQKFSLIRALNEMVDDGAISVNHREVTILNTAKLMKY